MWDKIKEIYAGGFAIVALSWVLVHLIMIQVNGVITIAEQNTVVLWAEIIMTTLLVGLAVERFIKDWRNLKGKR